MLETADGPYLFLYFGDVAITPSKLKIPTSDNLISKWNYALENETLELDKPYLLGVYRALENEMGVHDLRDENEVGRMIQDSHMFY